MSQTSYNILMGQSFAGMKADARYDVVESALAYLAINFGRAVSSLAGEADVHMPMIDQQTLTFSADFSASNVITVTVNGVACTAITYGTSHAATATALLAAIAAHPAVTSVSKNGAGRIYTINTKGVACVSSGVVVGGSTVTATAVNIYSNDPFRGIALHRHKQQSSIVPDAGYLANEVVDVLRVGKAWVETSVAVTADDKAYVDLAGGIGKFTNVSTNNMNTGGYFRSTNTGAGLALLEINIPNV